MIEAVLWILINGFFLYLAWEYIGLLWRPKQDRKRRMLLVFLCMVLWGMVNAGCYTLNHTGGILEAAALLVIVFIFVAGVFILGFLKNMVEEKRQLDAYLNHQQMEWISRQYHMIEENQEETRRQRHELKNHYLAIETMAEKGDIPGILELVRDLNRELHRNVQQAATGNVAVDAVLNYKIEHSKAEHIRFQLDLNIPVTLKVKDAVLCGVLGNVMDNAVDACSKIPVPDRLISVVMMIERKNLFVEVTNNYDGIVRTDPFGNLLTRKEEDAHGFGISQIQQLLKKNCGSVEVVWSDRQFQTRIVFYQVI